MITMRLFEAFMAGSTVGAVLVSILYSRRHQVPSRVFTGKLFHTSSATDEILAEHFTRNVQFFGSTAQQRVSSVFVVVVGLGGVGSHCAHMLLRSGVSRMRLIDFDQISLSSLNRHALGTRQDVGSYKAECLAKHFRKIFPEAQLETKVAMFEKTVEDELLKGEPDFVVDCIDNVDTKVDLLAACVRKNINVLASGGAGAKCDPTRIKIVDIRESVVDPLARAVRHRLKQVHGIESGIPVLLSTEKQRCKLARQVLSSDPILHIHTKQYKTQFERLRDREASRGSMKSWDVIYLIKDVWQGRSARAQNPSIGKGMWRNTSDLCLTRWNPSKPANLDNLILLSSEEADAHDAEVFRIFETDNDSDQIKPCGFDSLVDREPYFAYFIERKLQRVRRDFGLVRESPNTCSGLNIHLMEQ
eukprot:31471-Pelagococcus_subviridis.AAC.6